MSLLVALFQVALGSFESRKMGQMTMAFLIPEQISQALHLLGISEGGGVMLGESMTQS